MFTQHSQSLYTTNHTTILKSLDQSSHLKENLKHSCKKHAKNSHKNHIKERRRLIAVDETIVKVNGYRCYLWAAIDVDSREVLAVYVSKGRSILNPLTFLKMVF